MASQTYMTDLPAYRQPALASWRNPQSERLPYLALLMFLFIVLATGSAAKFPWNYVVKISGVILVLAYAVRSILARSSVSPEVFLYAAWIVWSTTGLIAGANQQLYRTSAGTVVQIWILLLLMAGYTNSRKVLSFNLFAFLLGAFFVWVNGLITGSFSQALESGRRATGMSMDPNGFGWLMIVATVAMAYFWMLPSRLGMFKYVLLVLGMAAAGVATILSGSRFSILGLTVFYTLWIWMCYRKEMFRRPSVLMVVVLGLALGGVGLVHLASRTVAGTRMRSTWQRLTGHTTYSGDAGRIDIYREGLAILARHPLFGVGLNNFRLHSSWGNVAHSEFLEVAADTGLPGFAIYFTIYFLMWRRAGKIAKHSQDPHAVKIAKLIRVYILVMLFIGLGATHYYSKTAWIVLGGFMGFSHALWQQIRAQSPVAGWQPGLAYEGYAA